jgi:hypothetical protein
MELFCQSPQSEANLLIFVDKGVLRNHVIMPDGSYRHSVFYSIIESDWPQVKANLEAKMQQYSNS